MSILGWTEERTQRFLTQQVFHDLLRMEKNGGIWDDERHSPCFICIDAGFIDTLEVYREYTLKRNDGTKKRRIAAGKFEINDAGREWLARMKPPIWWTAP